MNGINGFDDEGAICLRQVVGFAGSQAVIWTHRLRIEQAIRRNDPGAVPIAALRD